MKLGSKTTFALGAVAALLLALPLACGVLLRTSSARDKIAEALSKALDMEVRFGGFSPGVWSATRLSNLKASTPSGLSMSAREVMLRIQPLYLLRGKILISELRVDGVRVVKMDSSSAAAAGVANAGENRADAGGSLGAKRGTLLRALRTVQVTDAALDWVAADGRTKWQFEGAELRFSADASGDSSGGGSFKARRSTWMEAVQLETIEGEMVLSEGKISLQEIRALCGGALVKGAAELRWSDGCPFQLAFSTQGVDLEKMTGELPSLRLAGQAHASVRVEGAAEKAETWKGTAELDIREGRFKGVNLLQMIGQIFQIQEITNLKVREGRLRARIEDSKVHLDEVNLDAGDVVLSAPGYLDFKRNLSLNAQLALQQRLLNGRISQMFSSSFSPADDDGRRSIAFQVSGSLDKPATNLLEKVAGEGLGGAVNQLLGGFLKPRKPENREPQGEPKK